MVWIHTLARYKSEECAHRFPLSLAQHEGLGLDPDLRHLLRVNQSYLLEELNVAELPGIDPEQTPSHTMDFVCAVASFLDN